jgi:hypothetical protein
MFACGRRWAEREGTEREAMSFSPELRQQILVAVRQQPAPTRQTVRRQTVALVLAALGVSVLAFLAVGGPRPGGRALSVLLATAAGTAAIAGLTLRIGLGGGMLGRARSFLVLAAIAGPVAFLAWKGAFSPDFFADPSLSKFGYRCLALTFSFALTPLAALVFVRRGSDPTHPRALGVALAVGAGLWAASLVDLWCPVGNLRHLAFGHLLPVAVLGLAGLWLGGRVLAVRRRRSSDSGE